MMMNCCLMRRACRALLPNAAGLSRIGPIMAEVWFETPVAATDRKALARACEALVAARVAA